ncbi:MAG: hypothetical protein ACYCOU_16685 [Sulfobacillus sp.]
MISLTYVSALAALVAAVGSVGLFLENRRQRRALFRPFIVARCVDSKLHTFVDIDGCQVEVPLEFEVANIGAGPALNLSVGPDETLPWRITSSAVPGLGPHETFDIHVGPSGDDLRDKLRFRADYQDIFDEPHHNVFTFTWHLTPGGTGTTQITSVGPG